MRFIAKIKRIGGSYMAVIPKKIAEAEHIVAEEEVDIEVKKAKKKTFGIFKGMPPFTKEDKFDTHHD